MHKSERQKLILQIVNQKKFIKVNDIIIKLNSSLMTLNRDLNELKKQGLIETVWGGIQVPGYSVSNQTEQTRTQKINIHFDEKLILAKFCGSLIKDEDTVFIGPGTTLEQIVQFLDEKNIRIVTNSHYLLNNIKSPNNLTVISTGGSLRKNSGAFLGSITQKNLENFHFDLCFLGANAINNKGIYNSNLAEAEINKIVLECSKKKYVVVTNDKINKTDFVKFFSAKNLTIITNKFIDENQHEPINKKYSKFLKFIFI